MLNSMLLENEKINYSPMVLGSTLFRVVENETDIIGYWRDGEGQVYRDYIEARQYFATETFNLNQAIKNMFYDGEKCVFYKNVYNEGVIAYPDKTCEILKTRLVIEYTCQPCEVDIRLLLDKHNGLTIYKIDNGNYLIEIYK